MAITAADLMICAVFDGCLSMHDLEIERRPYHRNCNCELHKLKGVCSVACSNVLFPMKQSWKDCSLSIAIPGDSSSSKRDPKGALLHH